MTHVSEGVLRSALASLLIEAARPLPAEMEGALYVDYKRSTLTAALQQASWAAGLSSRRIIAAINLVATEYPAAVRVVRSKGTFYVRLYIAPSPVWDTALREIYGRDDYNAADVIQSWRSKATGAINDTLSADDVTPSRRRDRTHKRCPRCRETKPRSSFTARVAGDHNSRLSSWCKSCTRNLKNPEGNTRNASQVPQHPQNRRVVRLKDADHPGPGVRYVRRYVDADGVVLPGDPEVDGAGDAQATASPSSP